MGKARPQEVDVRRRKRTLICLKKEEKLQAKVHTAVVVHLTGRKRKINFVHQTSLKPPSIRVIFAVNRQQRTLQRRKTES